MKLSSPFVIMSLSSSMLVGQLLLLSSTTVSAQECCLCDDCIIDGLYGNEVGVDAPAGSTTTTLLTDCGDLAANLLLNTKSTDSECIRKKYVYAPICCPAKTTTTTTAAAAQVVVVDEKKNKNRILQQWTTVINYSPFGSTSQIRGSSGCSTCSTSSSGFSSWWVPVPAPRPTTQWFPAPVAPRPAPTMPRPAPTVPQPPPTNWGASPPTSSTTTSTGGSSAQDWINAHNTRRNQYHSQNRVTYVAIKWSDDLANSARTYTQRLLSGFTGCNIQHKFQGDTYGGENLALQVTGSTTSYSAEAVMRLWYDGELGLPYPQNGHLTQVVWRGTMYVGCAGLTKTMSNGQICHIQTCRYLAPGNCNGVGNILAATSACTPQCPREGCF